MRHGAAGRRSRNRGNSGRRGNQNRTQVFDSNGPEVRIRGTAHQICEKYVALAKDSAASGDQVLAESYLQHAEHYQRIINGWEDTLSGKVEIQEDEPVTKTKSDSKNKEVDGNIKQESQKEDLGLPESIVGKKKEKVLEDAV